MLLPNLAQWGPDPSTNESFVGPDKDFRKFDPKSACARSVRKFLKNLPGLRKICLQTRCPTRPPHAHPQTTPKSHQRGVDCTVSPAADDAYERKKRDRPDHPNDSPSGEKKGKSSED